MSSKLVVLLLVSAGMARADGLTLSNALATAMAGNPELRAARLQIAVATGRAQQTRAWPNPELELSASDMPANAIGLARAKNMVGISQTVPFPGKKALDGRIGRQEITVAESESRDRERELIRAVKSAFYRTLATGKKLAVAQQLLELTDSLGKAASQRVESGAAGNQERLRAEIEHERARLDVAAARREWADAQRDLARLLGQPPGELAGELRTDVPALIAEPNRRTAQANRDRAELEWQRARLDALPDVTFGVAGGRDTAANENLVEFRVSLPLPLFDRGQGRHREARARAELARAELTATEHRLAQELAGVDHRLQVAGEQVAAYRERIVPKAEEALRLVQTGFAAGKFSFLELVDTQRTVAEARLGYLDQLLELNLALAEWEMFAGTQVKE
ncbi:MAG: Cobalt-zinc-cadmium resistance protein CzcC [Verrucomicrobiae bacterium]|nr:Cobalt-zinc-cadmium resistance protein CzcC [Verrucomicrobiae bacterium]